MTAQARSASSPPVHHEKKGRDVQRRMWLPKHLMLTPTKRTPSQASSALAAAVTAPPSAVSGITNISNDSSNVYSETAITANPSNASQFLALSNEPTQNYMPTFASADGGATWSQHSITPPTANVPTPIFLADPSVVPSGPTGVAAAYIAVDNFFETSLEFASGGFDGTFPSYASCPSVSACHEVTSGIQPDKPFISRDNQGNFYIAYDANPPMLPGSQPILFVNSKNSFSSQVTVWDSGGDIGAYPAVMPNGTNAPTIYVAWLDYCGNTPNSVNNQCSAPNGRLLIAKSSDYGATFTRLDGTAIDQSCTTANFGTCGPSLITNLTTGFGSVLPNYGGSCAMGCAPRTISSFPSMDVDHSGGTHNGRIYVVWADGAQPQAVTATYPSGSRMHIFMSFFDPGVSTSWSAPIQIDTGNVNNDSWQPSAAVDQSNGNLVVTWYDRRDDTNNHLYRPYYAQSADGGATWSAQVPLSPNMSDPQIDCNGTGDYMQVIAVGGHARPAWTEMSASTPQVWTADIDETKLPVTFSSTTTAGNLRDPNGTNWRQLPGSARDIGVGPDSGCTVSVIGTDNLAGGGGVYIWTGTRWAGPIAGGSGRRISTNAGGFPRVVTKTNAIYRLLINNNGAIYCSQAPGSGIDIASGADTSLWIIGTNPVPGGYGVWAFDGSTGGWVQFTGFGVRIAADPGGAPWVVDSSHRIFCFDKWAGWFQIPGSANDIGVGANGEIWVIGTNPVPGGFGIYRWNGPCTGPPPGNWVAVAGGGVGISVGTDGLPFIVNSAGQIFERMF